MKRRSTRKVRIGDIKIGGNEPIRVQSMCNTDTRDIRKTVKQIHSLEDADCEIIRVAVPDLEAAKAIKEIKKEISIPLVADIHFDYKLALVAADYADKLRINPGNIGKRNIRKVVDKAKDSGIPIRIGVNLGSLEKDLLTRYGATPEALVESALRHVRLLEEQDFHDIVISLKASDVIRTINAYKMMADAVDYPLHIGLTEAGLPSTGTVKSSIALGYLLINGIGDTIRVSLTAEPEQEVKVGYEILKSLGLRKGPKIISCPTCGRTEIDVIDLATQVERRLKMKNKKKDITIAVMGCAVNGPGEAREADVGIAGAKDYALIFKKGQVIRKLKGDRSKMLDALLDEISKM